MTVNPTPFVGTEEEKQRIANAVPKQAPAQPKKARKLLVTSLNIRDGEPRKGHAAIPYGNLALELMGKQTGAFEPVFDNDIDMFLPQNLQQFDAVFFNNTVGVLFEDAERQQALMDFVTGGKGLVGIHAAGATFCQYPRYDQWPAFGEMLGGYENGGHPWGIDDTITIRVEDRSSALTRMFQEEDFDIQDEVFQFKDHYSREKLHVLLRINTDKTDTGPNRRILPDRRADMDLAMSWIRQHGQGRVFYSSFGHNPKLYWDERILQHFLAGTQYALGDLAADATPSAPLKP